VTDTLSAAVRYWLFEEALPFWAENGVDRVFGGYVEQLRLDGTDARLDYKRIRVIGRQIYVFSHAALLGWSDGVALARHGYDFLTRYAWLGPERGWARSLDREGRVKDETPDLYDLAFILFALGWYYRLTADPEALRWALRTLDFLDAHMRHSNRRGFLDQNPSSGPRRQNPHMHLFEAAVINLESGGGARFKALADEMVGLCSDHFYDPATQTLGEYFDDDWARVATDAGQAIEPGHQFEWAWILARYQRGTARDVRDLARGLVAFAEANGVDPESGLTFNLVRRDGLVLDRSSRVWPNTERIQAAAAMFELEGWDPRPVFEQSGWLLLRRFLSGSPRGTWIDRLGEDGTPRSDMIPASTLYHLVIAFSELLRVDDAVSRAFPVLPR
jgi:N-acylglucosamine 2-epimerase/mannose-6-phosphate isomerase